MSKNIYIFDLDGTIALIEHRRHLVENGGKKWDEFFAACVDDLPNEPVIKMAQLIAADPKHAVVIFSGRSEVVRPQTVAWLKKHSVPYHILWMRPDKDYTPDDMLKKQWLYLEPGVKDDIVCVFDDRDKVVKMWRDEGLTCFQVAPGDF